MAGLLWEKKGGGWGCDGGGGGGFGGGGAGRLQVSNSVYISPVEATADCSVIHTGRRA